MLEHQNSVDDLAQWGIAASSVGGPYYGNEQGPDGPLAREGIHVGVSTFFFLMSSIFRNIYSSDHLYIPENIPEYRTINKNTACISKYHKASRSEYKKMEARWGWGPAGMPFGVRMGRGDKVEGAFGKQGRVRLTVYLRMPSASRFVTLAFTCARLSDDRFSSATPG